MIYLAIFILSQIYVIWEIFRTNDEKRDRLRNLYLKFPSCLLILILAPIWSCIFIFGWIVKALKKVDWNGIKKKYLHKTNKMG